VVLLALLIALFCVGCSTSHLVVGTTRLPIDPARVKVYLVPPRHYETIAIVSADSNGSFRFTGQGKVDAALDRAKRDAAKLGANGLLLQTLGESGSVTVGNGYTTGTRTSSNTSFVGVSGGGLIKNISVLAIYVTEE
jgi:hypothetical protein